MTSLYQHIAVAVDLTDESRHVIDQAIMIAQRTGARLSVVHTLGEVSTTYGADDSINVDTLRQQLTEHAHARLQELAFPYGINTDQLYILGGQADTAIKTFATDHQADLIVVGSHGRTGWALMLGSTSADVLRNAECDVLAVKVQGVQQEPVD
ncbi:universal stress protein [Carnimonas nigrificans]|uniref:universal stress protein n=1 Tax=Carnimonas nigrificans TaxID=64323 RepID=UPI000470D601|nr:universal stress protein [Carnimonas nigrificans]